MVVGPKPDGGTNTAHGASVDCGGLHDSRMARSGAWVLFQPSELEQRKLGAMFLNPSDA